MPGQDEVGGVASFVFSASSAFFTAKVLTIETSTEVPVVPMTALDRAASGGHDFAMGRIKRYTLTGTAIYDASLTPPVGSTGTLAITYRDAGATVVTWSKASLASIGHSISLDERMEGPFAFELGGVPTLVT